MNSINSITGQLPHYVTQSDATKFRTWIRERGGVAVWQSRDLSDPGKSVSTPATIRKGDCQGQEGDRPEEIIPYPKPGWQFGSQPDRVITDEKDILVCYDEEVKRFRVGLRRSGNGLSVKCTDASSKRIRTAVEKAGKGAYHRFDYETQEAVIMKPARIVPLNEFKD